MAADEKQLCVICAWRGTCNKKFSGGGGESLHCVDFVRDVSLKPPAVIKKANILLTGMPGVGKTTLIVKLAAEMISQMRLRPGGFYTHETREGFFRSGFKIFSLDGREGVLADTKLDSPHKVGKYGVDVKALEDIGVASLEAAISNKDIDVIIIDEIGRMEAISQRFKDAVLAALNSPKIVVATIQHEGNGYIFQIKNREDVKLIEVTEENRGKLAGDILSMLT
ncbi:MAG: NTPase [Nitrospirae bacterium]|nr:NTPase [Nitrospirota bacterium]